MRLNFSFIHNVIVEKSNIVRLRSKLFCEINSLVVFEKYFSKIKHESVFTQNQDSIPTYVSKQCIQCGNYGNNYCRYTSTLLQPRSENYFKRGKTLDKIWQIFREIDTLKLIEQKLAKFALLKWLYLEKCRKVLAEAKSHENLNPKEPF